MKYTHLLFLCFLVACTGITSIKKGQYSDAFISRVEGIQQIFKSGDHQTAISKIKAIDDSTLSSLEKSKKYNTLGIFYFNKNKYNSALGYFKEALTTAGSDAKLESQVYLNLASSHFKLSDYQKANDILNGMNVDHLPSNEQEKYYKIKYLTAIQAGDNSTVLETVIPLLSSVNSINEIENSEYREVLVSSYKNLSKTERSNALTEAGSKNQFVAGYLAKIEIERRFFEGDREGANQVIEWVKNNFSNSDIENYTTGTEDRSLHMSEIDPKAIGIVLPMTGVKSRFGKKAINGIDYLMRSLKQKGFQIYYRDSDNNPLLAASAVEELIKQHHVAAIVGGLFTKTSIQEYQMAKKYGVLFLSLSSVLLDKDNKNHLLIEMSGSVESQLSVLFNNENLKKLGKKAGLFYKENNSGQAYFNEFWRKMQTTDVELKAIDSYQGNQDDYRAPVKNILGLKYLREREKELSMWKKVFSYSKKGSIKRIQELPPIVEYDWLFMSSSSREALQIIPAFRYYDVKGMTYIGGPNWLSYQLIKEQRNLGNVLFIGDHPKKVTSTFKEGFKSHFSKPPKIIETLSYEALSLASNILTLGDFSQREELEKIMIDQQKVKGRFYGWALTDNLWLKNMSLLKIQNNSVEYY